MPKTTAESAIPAVDIDVTRRYIAVLVAFTEQPATYEGAKAGEMADAWKFHLYDAETKEPVLSPQDLEEPHEFWVWANDRTDKNEARGYIARGRLYTESLLGGPMTNEQMDHLIDQGFAEALIGKKMLVDVDWVTGKKSGKTRLDIIRCFPLKRPAAKAAPVADDAPAERFTPDGAPVLAGAGAARRPTTVAAAQNELGLDDDELPF
jgi:hypothetical protein